MIAKRFRIVPEGTINSKKLDLLEFQKELFAMFPIEEATRIANRTIFESSFVVEKDGKRYSIITD